jgi:hypothetical protein
MTGSLATNSHAIGAMNKMRTLFEKVWDAHIVAQEEDETLLYVDRCLIHEGSRHTFDTLQERGLSVAHPDKIFAFSDHYVPTDRQIRAGDIAGIPDLEIRNMVELLIRNTDEYKISRFGWGDDRQSPEPVASFGIMARAAPDRFWTDASATSQFSRICLVSEAETLSPVSLRHDEHLPAGVSRLCGSAQLRPQLHEQNSEHVLSHAVHFAPETVHRVIDGGCLDKTCRSGREQ